MRLARHLQRRLLTMKLGIVGLPNVGKSTLFNAITNAGVPADNYAFCTIDPNVGVVSVPDERLQWLSDFHNPKKTTPARAPRGEAQRSTKSKTSSVARTAKKAFDEGIREIVAEVFTNGSKISGDILYFRADYYHAWAINEFHIDNTYFSSSPWYQEV